MSSQTRFSAKHLKNQSLLLPVHETPWRNHDIIVHIREVIQRNTAAHGKQKIRFLPWASKLTQTYLKFQPPLPSKRIDEQKEEKEKLLMGTYVIT